MRMKMEELRERERKREWNGYDTNMRPDEKRRDVFGELFETERREKDSEVTGLGQIQGWEEWVGQKHENSGARGSDF